MFCKGDPDAPREGVSSDTYIKVLQEGLVPLYESGDLFVQDNAPIYKSGASMGWLEEQQIDTVDWPPHSPDLNPIEHVWHTLKKKIRQIEPNFSDLKKNLAHEAYVREIIQLAWSELDPDFICSLIGSMEARLKAVIKAPGWYTHY